jgi:hypothetical protein
MPLPTTTLTFDGTASTPSTTLTFSTEDVLGFFVEQKVVESGSLTLQIQQNVVEGGQVTLPITQQITQTGSITFPIQQDGVEQGAISLTLTQTNFCLGSLSLAVQQIVTPPDTIDLPITQQLVNTGQITLPIQQNVGDSLTFHVEHRVIQQGSLAFPVTQNVQLPQVDELMFPIQETILDSYPNRIVIPLRNFVEFVFVESGELGFGIQQTTYELVNGLPAKPTNWEASVTLNGVDVTDNLTGNILIEAEEGTAKVATFSLKPTPGVINLTNWVDKLVVISFSYKDSPASFTLYKGFVETPTFNTVSRIISFTCTDKLQSTFKDQSQAQILQLIQGQWSIHIFNETNDNWEYAQDVLSTVTKSIDLSVNLTADITEWKAKATPDFTYQENCILDESLDVEVANARDIINTVDMSFTYQYSAFKEVKTKVDWNGNPAIGSAEWLNDPFPLVSNKMVVEAIESAGWVLSKPFFSWASLPVTQVYTIGGQPIAFNNAAPNAIEGINTFIAKRYVQNITEAISFTLKAPSSIAALGPLKQKAQYGVSAQYAETAESDFLNTAPKVYTYRSNTGGGILSFLQASFDYKAYEAFNGQESPVGIGTVPGTTIFDTDSLITVGDRAETDSALSVARDVHVRQITEAHRQTRVEFETVLNPLLSRTQTIKVDTGPVKAQGKLYSYRQELNIEQGSALSTITVAISKEYGTGIVDIVVPDVTPTTPAVVLEDTPGLIQLGNFLEGFSGPLGSETGSNEFGRKSRITGGLSTTFDIQSPEIPDTSTQELTDPQTKEYIVSIPIDLLILEA